MIVIVFQAPPCRNYRRIMLTKIVIDILYSIIIQFDFQPFFTDRVFEIFDKDNSGSISLDEFIDAMHQFAGKSTDDKIKFLFKVYDLDGK